MTEQRPRKRRSRHVLFVAVLIAAMGLVSAIGTLSSTTETEAAPLTAGSLDHVTIRIKDLTGSGVSGKATLRAGDGVTTIGIRIDGDAAAYPTHIHEGTCSGFEAMPGVPLADAVPGQTSRTTIETPLDELLGDFYVINIHHPETHLGALLDPASVIACGEIAVEATDQTGGDVGKIMPPDTGVGSTIAEHSSRALTIILSLLAVVTCGFGILLRRVEQRQWVPYPV